MGFPQISGVVLILASFRKKIKDPMQNQRIVLHRRPVGLPQLSDFQFQDIDQPEVESGKILLKACYVSVDPYLRGRMSDAKSYLPPFELDQPLESGMIAEVIESNHSDFKKGEYVFSLLPWQKYQCSDGQGLRKVDPQLAPLPAYLSVLGLTGLTAYLGLSEIGKPQAGETLFVSGAAGAVGSIVGQIGKLTGCTVVGSAGSDEKVDYLINKYGFDAGFNYKTTTNYRETLAKLCPQGIDVYFDNVGGALSEAVFPNINPFARLVICGSIAYYNATEMPQSIAVQPFLIKKSALMQGFVVRDYASKFSAAIQQLGQWLATGQIVYDETMVEGFDHIPQAFIDLFSGKNIGKMVIKV